jgi:parvulin-like peptidyl-prolyl isomerase
MRRLIILGVLISVAAWTPSSAMAGDADVRAVVQQQAVRQAKEDERFVKATRNVKTRKDLNRARRAAKRQTASVKEFKAALVPTRADTPVVAEGRRQLLNALNLYTKGIVRLRSGIREALNPGGNSGVAKLKSARRSMRKASNRAVRAARKIG